MPETTTPSVEVIRRSVAQMSDRIFPTFSIGENKYFDGVPRSSATWNRALTDAEVDMVREAMTASPFEPTALELGAPRTLMWRDEDGIVRRITRRKDKRQELLVWWIRDDSYDGDDPDGAWKLDRIEAVDGL